MLESKLFRIVFLTLVMYGFISFLQWGIFLVPLPAFELVILGISIYLGIREYKSDKILFALFLLYGIAQFLGRDYNFAFILSEEQMYAFTETIWIDMFYLISAVLISSLFIRQSVKVNWNKILFGGIAILLFTSFLFPYTWLVGIPLTIICFLHLRKNSLFISQHSIWAYLLLFVVSRTLTLNLL